MFITFHRHFFFVSIYESFTHNKRFKFPILFHSKLRLVFKTCVQVKASKFTLCLFGQVKFKSFKTKHMFLNGHLKSDRIYRSVKVADPCMRISPDHLHLLAPHIHSPLSAPHLRSSRSSRHRYKNSNETLQINQVEINQNVVYD